jgi:hypothetical protein
MVSRANFASRSAKVRVNRFKIDRLRPRDHRHIAIIFLRYTVFRIVRFQKWNLKRSVLLISIAIVDARLTSRDLMD